MHLSKSGTRKDSEIVDHRLEGWQVYHWWIPDAWWHQSRHSEWSLPSSVQVQVLSRRYAILFHCQQVMWDPGPAAAKHVKSPPAHTQTRSRVFLGTFQTHVTAERKADKLFLTFVNESQMCTVPSWLMRVHAFFSTQPSLVYVLKIGWWMAVNHYINCQTLY